MEAASRLRIQFYWRERATPTASARRVSCVPSAPVQLADLRAGARIDASMSSTCTLALLMFAAGGVGPAAFCLSDLRWNPIGKAKACLLVIGLHAERQGDVEG